MVQIWPQYGDKGEFTEWFRLDRKAKKKFRYAAAFHVAAWSMQVANFGAGSSLLYSPGAYLVQISLEKSTDSQPALTNAQFTTRHSNNLLAAHYSSNDEQASENSGLLNRERHLPYVSARADPKSSASPSKPNYQPDFWNVYLWNYCQGNSSIVPGKATRMDLKQCSPATYSASFNTMRNIEQILPSDLKANDPPENDNQAGLIFVTVVGSFFASTSALMLFIVIAVPKGNRLFVQLMIFFLIFISAIFQICASGATTTVACDAAKAYNATVGSFIAITWPASVLEVAALGVLGVMFHGWCKHRHDYKWKVRIKERVRDKVEDDEEIQLAERDHAAGGFGQRAKAEVQYVVESNELPGYAKGPG